MPAWPRGRRPASAGPRLRVQQPRTQTPSLPLVTPQGHGMSGLAVGRAKGHLGAQALHVLPPIDEALQQRGRDAWRDLQSMLGVNSSPSALSWRRRRPQVSCTQARIPAVYRGDQASSLPACVPACAGPHSCSSRRSEAADPEPSTAGHGLLSMPALQAGRQAGRETTCSTAT